MAKNSPIPVRFDPQTAAQLEQAAQSLGIPKSMIIRMLVERFVDSFEKNGGRITMPIQVVGADECDDCLRIAAERPATYGGKKNKNPASNGA